MKFLQSILVVIWRDLWGGQIGRYDQLRGRPERGAKVSRPKTIPRVLNQTSTIKLLEEHGWTRTAGGKHQVKMEKEGCRPITLPDNGRRDYAKGFRQAILRQAGLAGPGSSEEQT